MNKIYALYALSFVTLWDTITTIYGTVGIFGSGIVQIFISTLFGLIISSFLLRTMSIINNPKEDVISIGEKILWFLAICYDLYTSFIGNQELVLNSSKGGFAQVVMTVGLTIFVSFAPIGISKIRYQGDLE